MRRQQGYIGWGGLALLCVAAFLLIASDALQMHPDEELSYAATNGSLSDAIEYQTSLQDNQAPLWFVTFWAWRNTVGDGEYTSRVLSTFLTLLALAFTYRVARRSFGDMAAALALLLLIGNGLFFNFALDIRPYPLVMLVSAFGVWRLQVWLANQTRRNTVLLGIAFALMLYTHYLLTFFIVALAIYTLLAHRLTRRLAVQAVAAVVLAAVLFAPWFPVFVSQMNHLRNMNEQAGAERGIAGVSVSTLPTTPETIGALINAASNGLWWLYGALLLAGAALLWRRRTYWLALAWALLTPTVYLLANLVASVYVPRYVAYAILGLGVALAAAIVAITSKGLQPLARNPIYAYALASVLVVGFVGANLATFAAQIPPRVPYRAIYRDLSAQAQPDDALLMYPTPIIEGFITWQLTHYLAQPQREQIIYAPDEAAQSRRVWFITNDWFGDGVQDTFRTLERTHPLQTVLGDCNRHWCYLAQLMEAPPNDTPQTFGDAISFYGTDIDRAAADGIRVRLWLRADAPISLDYSIGAQLLDSSGVLVAQSDGAINHYGSEIVQTSAMQVGQIYIDHRTLTPAAPLPDGEYQLVVIVYQSWDGARLTLPDGSDSVAAADMTIRR